MQTIFTLNKLSMNFYESYPANVYTEIEYKPERPYNLHLHVGKTNKYMFNGQDSFIGAGKLNKTNFVKNGIEKGIKTAKRLGWRL